MSEDFRPHSIVWTPELVGRMWSYLARRDVGPERYFSAVSGDAILRFAERHGAPLRGRVLDYGCGPGFLLEKLARRGSSCEGLEFSEESACLAQARASVHPSFAGVVVAQGLPTPLASGAFDAAFVVETLEHLLDPELEAALAEVSRVLRPGGTIVVTTPNDESLEVATVMCPECGCTFHGMQHVRSFSARALRRRLEASGYFTRFCAPVFFDRSTVLSRAYGWALRLGRMLPHLAYVGTKAT